MFDIHYSLFQSFFFRSNWSPIAAGLNLDAWNDYSPSLTLQTTHLIFFNDIKTQPGQAGKNSHKGTKTQKLILY